MNNVKKAKFKPNRKQIVNTPNNNTKRSPNKTKLPPNKYMLIALLAIVVITYIAFSPSLDNGYVGWDDDMYIHDDILSQQLNSANVKTMFTTYQMANYHPVTLLVYGIEYSFFKLKPYGYHFMNILYHLINICLLFWFMMKFTRKMTISIIVCALFALHPLHVESVTWISEKKDLLYTMFFILSLIAYLNYSENREEKKYGWYILSLILFVVSCMAKGMAVSLSVVLIFIDYFKEKKLNTKLIIEKIPFLIVSLIFGIVAIQAQKASQGVYNISVYSTMDKLLFPIYAVFFYIYKMILPIDLSIVYPYPQKPNGMLPTIYYIAPLIILGLTVVIFITRKKTKSLIFGSLFYLACVAPIIQILPVGISIASDRYFYVASIGLFFIVGERADYLIQKLKANKNIVWGVFGLIMLTLTITTYGRTKVWHDSFSLWKDVTIKQPLVDNAYYGIALCYHHGGATDSLRYFYTPVKKNIDSAIFFYRLTLQTKPDNDKALNNLGNCYFNKNMIDSAYIYYDRLVKIKPDYHLGLHNMGNVIMQKGDNVTARQYFRRALKSEPNFALSYYALGLTFINSSRDSAKYFIRKAADIGDSNSVQFFRNNPKY